MRLQQQLIARYVYDLYPGVQFVADLLLDEAGHLLEVLDAPLYPGHIGHVTRQGEPV
jgi:hypothetical protein